MNQAEVSKLVTKLRINVKPIPRRLRSPKGPEGRLDKLRKTVTGLIKYERIELNYNRADEARQYTERLISEAIRHGDCHKPTMDIADYWLLEKELVHKLFKVLVPRYENSKSAVTRMHYAPKPQYARILDKVVLELKENPYPDLLNKQANNKHAIQNVLLEAAKQDYRQWKIKKLAKSIGTSEERAEQLNIEQSITPNEPSASETNNSQKKIEVSKNEQ